MRIMAYNNLIMQMALLFSAEEDVIYSNIGVGHLLLSTLMPFDIQIDSCFYLHTCLRPLGFPESLLSTVLSYLKIG